nr:DUF1385 domain-containing protein [Ammoniphilus oxalaticus]
MSYPKGVFFMNKHHLAHATILKDNEVVTKIYKLDNQGMRFFIYRTLFSVPFYFLLILIAAFVWISRQPTFPFYWLLLLAFGYHFMFPHSLKQYHGAEHKVFSYHGKKTLDALERVRASSIVNRNCSTNLAVTFYIVFLIGWWPLGGHLAALVALIAGWAIPRFLKPMDQKVLFPISAFLQRRVTTTEPETRHLKAALLAYISLIRNEAVTEQMLLEEKRLEQEREQIKQREERILETEYREI